MRSSLLFIVGASGSGKTAAVQELAGREPSGIDCHHFDSIGVPSEAEMIARCGSLERWQESETHRWIDRLLQSHCGSSVQVLEGQTRPSFISSGLAQSRLVESEVLLLDCASTVRAERLRARGQPDLATRRMECWAAYLRGQADALGLRTIDTSDLTVAEVATELRRQVESLRARTRTA